MVALTIGLIARGSRDDLIRTLDSIQANGVPEGTEFLVADCSATPAIQEIAETLPSGQYVDASAATGSAVVRDLVFALASGDITLCCDAGVHLAPRAIDALLRHLSANPASADLLQGPRIDADGTVLATHLDTVWERGAFGRPALDPRGAEPNSEPFPIPMQSLALVACRSEVWPGSHPELRGVSSDEGAIHERVRRAGGQCLCLPGLRWTWTAGSPVPPGTIAERLRNAVITRAELGVDPGAMLRHFSELTTEHQTYGLASETLAELFGVSLAVPPDAPRRRDYHPLISCICMTYNRAPDHLVLIEEAIEAFLRQTYPNKELILINDTPGQELVCDAPAVRVLNVATRFPTLGDKQNAALAVAAGELIAQWDDDDISLPWRLELSYDRLGDGDYLNPRANWLVSYGEWSSDHAMGVGHNASLITRVAHDLAGDFPAMSLGYDAWIDQTLQRITPRVVDPQHGMSLGIEEWFYIYRWGVSPVHVSGNADPTLFQAIGERPVRQGRFTLRPYWQIDYVAKTRELIRERQARADYEKQ